MPRSAALLSVLMLVSAGAPLVLMLVPLALRSVLMLVPLRAPLGADARSAALLRAVSRSAGALSVQRTVVRAGARRRRLPAEHQRDRSSRPSSAIGTLHHPAVPHTVTLSQIRYKCSVQPGGSRRRRMPCRPRARPSRPPRQRFRPPACASDYVARPSPRPRSILQRPGDGDHLLRAYGRRAQRLVPFHLELAVVTQMFVALARIRAPRPARTRLVPRSEQGCAPRSSAG